MVQDTDSILDRRRMKRRLSWWRAAAIVAVAALALGALSQFELTRPFLPGRDYVARITISGVIFDDPTITDAIAAVAEDDRARALMVLIDSPGGTTTGGEVLFREIRRVADAAKVIARRRNIEHSRPLRESVVAHLTGALLLAAYPDRLAKNRGTKGQFVMRAGGGAWVNERDELATESFIVAADVDGDRKSTRIRRGAGLDADQVALMLGDDVVEEIVVQWDKERNDLARTVTRKCGSLRLDERVGPPLPGPDTEHALVERVRMSALGILSWDDRARSTQRRMQFAQHHLGDSWPDVSDKHLVRTVDEWLSPYVAGCTCRADIEALDVDMLLRARLSWDTSTELDSLAPPTLVLPNGKEAQIDYSDVDRPVLSVRVQRVFGMTAHPTLLGGRVPVVVELLSPADRPIQVTSDLPGFWRGSWAEVRRDMAGRYPKHDWPVDPTK